MDRRCESVCAERAQCDRIKPTEVAFDAQLEVCADQPVCAERGQELKQATRAQLVEPLDLTPETEIADVAELYINKVAVISGPVIAAALTTSEIAAFRHGTAFSFPAGWSGPITSGHERTITQPLRRRAAEHVCARDAFWRGGDD